MHFCLPRITSGNSTCCFCSTTCAHPEDLSSPNLWIQYMISSYSYIPKTNCTVLCLQYANYTEQTYKQKIYLGALESQNGSKKASLASNVIFLSLA